MPKLCLASSLKGAARAILNELDGDKRRDYDSLVHALHNRFGSLHRCLDEIAYQQLYYYYFDICMILVCDYCFA
jgi:CRISPR/Cas system CSM-associated protein Csm3 (group 7 of RAMP superfamily)